MKPTCKALRSLILEQMDMMGYEGPNPPSDFPIRVGWDGGSVDVDSDEELERITRGLVSQGVAYSVDSVRELEPEMVPVGGDIEQMQADPYMTDEPTEIESMVPMAESRVDLGRWNLLAGTSKAP